MPPNENTAATWNAASQLGSTAMQVGAAASANRATRNWNEKMYSQQRDNALADWDKQNAYNSPLQQMARLKAAGLNPNLIYGSGTAAASSQSPIRSTDTKSYTPQIPDFGGFAAVIPAFLDVLKTQAETQRIESENRVLVNKPGLLNAQTENLQANTAKTKVDTQLSQISTDLNAALLDTNVATGKQRLDKLTADTTFTIDENARRSLSNDMSLRQGLESILTARLGREKTSADIANARASLDVIQNNAALQQLDISLKSKGFSWADPYYMRIGATVLDQIIKSSDTTKQILGNFLSFPH